MITLKRVSKSYSGKIKAVDGIDLTVENGEIFGFLGPNGAGKTTTIKMITGILDPDEGEVLINDVNIAQDPVRAKKMFGFVPDDPNIFPRLKAIEYLQFMGNLFDVPADRRASRITDMARQFELTSALGNRIQSFSHGMRQKLMIIGALLHEPDVWILDEPMTGLDPKSSYQLKEMMRQHADSGRSVFFSTHVLDVAERVCDRVAVIDQGKILFCGTIDEMRRHFQSTRSLEEMFLQLVDVERQTNGQAETDEAGDPA